MLLCPLSFFFEVMNVESCPVGCRICGGEGMQHPSASEALVLAGTWCHGERGSDPWWCSLSRLHNGSQARVTLWDLYEEPQKGQEVLLLCYHAEKAFRSLRLHNCPGCNSSSPLKPSAAATMATHRTCPSPAVRLREEPAPGAELLCSLLWACVCVCVCSVQGHMASSVAVYSP